MTLCNVLIIIATLLNIFKLATAIQIVKGIAVAVNL